MSNLENKLKKIVYTFNNINREEGYRDIKKLSEKYKKSIKVQNVLSQISQKMGDINTTINSLKKILLTENNNIDFLTKIYKLFLTKSSLDDALENINLILKIEKNNYEATRDKAYIHFLKNEFAEATKCIEKIAKLKDDDYFGYNIKGLISLKNSKLDIAKNYFENAIKINKQYVDSYNNLGVCLLELEKLNEAYEIFLDGFNIDTKNIKTLINLGNVLSLQDKILEAIKIYNQALNLDPNNQEILSNIAICYCREGKLEEAKIYYDRAIEINPHDYKLQYAYCTLQLKLNKFSNSWNLFDSRLLIEKNKVKLINFELVKNKLFDNLKIGPKENLLILREQGIGEEILFSSVYQDIIKKFKNIKIEADKRLVSIFNRSFEKDIFVKDGYYSNSSKISEFESVVYAGSMVKFFRKRKADFKNKKFLLARKDWITVEEVLYNLDQLVKSGKIRYAGLSNETPWGVMKYLQISKEKNLPRMMSIQNVYSLVNRVFDIHNSEVSIRESCGLLAYSPLAGGRLSGKYIGGQNPRKARYTLWPRRFSRHHTERGERAIEKYFKLAQKHNIAPSTFANAFVNDRPFVTSNIIGATTMDQLKENIDSIDISLSKELLKEIEDIHLSDPNPCV